MLIVRSLPIGPILYIVSCLDSIPPLVAPVFVGAGCSGESYEPATPAPVAAAIEDLGDEAGEDFPLWPDVEFFVRRHASGGSVGAFGRFASEVRQAGTSTFGHSAWLVDGGNEYGAKWCWLGRGEGGDRYAVEVTISGSELSTTRKTQTEVVYRGERLVVYRDEEWEIGVGPQRAEQKRGR